MREDLDMIWQQENKQEAEKQLDYWYQNVKVPIFPYCKKLPIASMCIGEEYSHGMIAEHRMQKWKG